MSLSGEREEIANVLGGINGVNGYKFRPKVFVTGNAWPLLDFLERGPANDFEVHWRVVVVLPANEQEASTWFDEKHEAIAEALLEQFGVVERIEPGVIATEVGDRECMIVTLYKEA